MKDLLTTLAISANIGTLAGLWLATGETLSPIAPALFAGVSAVSLVALVAKAGK